MFGSVNQSDEDPKPKLIVRIGFCTRGSRNFRQGGGGGVQVSLTKKALTTVFFYFTEVKWSISKKSFIFQGSRGGSTFIFQGGGGPTFPGGGWGSNCLFPIETHITCDFPGGVRTPCPPPLDLHLFCTAKSDFLSHAHILNGGNILS